MARSPSSPRRSVAPLLLPACLALVWTASSGARAAPPEVQVEVLTELEPPGFGYEITLVPGGVFEPADRYVVVAKGRQLSVWHVAPRRMTPMTTAEIGGKGSAVTMFGLAVADDGDTIATLADDGTLQVWTGTLTPIASLSTPAPKGGFGAQAAVGVATRRPLAARTAPTERFDGDRVHVVDFLQKKEVVVLEAGATGRFTELRFSRDGGHLLALGHERAVVWDIASGKVVDQLVSKDLAAPAFGADGRSWLVQDGARVVARSLGGEPLFMLDTDITPGPSNRLVVDADGRWLALTSRAEVTRWDLATRAVSGRVRLPGLPAVTHLSPDGRVALCVSTTTLRALRLTWP